MSVDRIGYIELGRLKVCILPIRRIRIAPLTHPSCRLVPLLSILIAQLMQTRDGKGNRFTVRCKRHKFPSLLLLLLLLLLLCGIGISIAISSSSIGQQGQINTGFDDPFVFGTGYLIRGKFRVVAKVHRMGLKASYQVLIATRLVYFGGRGGGG